MALETEETKAPERRYSRTRTLRWIVLGSGVVLVGVVAGFIVVAKYRVHDYLKGLPKRLGVDIQQETNNFTYSQSSKGKKIFTVHASKEVQRKDGKITLHDVGITLYDAVGQPADRIHGADFEYDQKAQLLTATGEVYIDLVPPAKKDAAGPATPEEESARVVHVKTVGLVFVQSEQTAKTDGAVEFRAGGYAGNSVGASYDAKSGVVVLNSAVRLSGLRNERPVLLTASRAEMDRPTNVIDLQHARYVSAGDGGSESVAAAHAVVHTTTDGTPQRVDAEGSVTLGTDQRGTVVSKRMEMELGDKGQARAAHLFGDVRYENDEGKKRDRGHAEDAKIAFDAVGRPVRAAFAGPAPGSGAAASGVTFVEQGPGSLHALDASFVNLVLSGGGKEPTVVRGAEAFGPGGARLMLADDGAKGRSSTEVKADRLTGRFAEGAKTTELTGLDGSGHSWLQRIGMSFAGAQTGKDTSTGEVLHLDFKPDERGKTELVRAEQRGGVVMVHEETAKTGAKRGQIEVEHGRADDAVYEEKANLAHLMGSVELQDEASALFADRVDLDRGSGDATANGAVRVTYVSEPAVGASAPTTAPEPVHVLAARAVAHKATGLAEFFADAGGRVRMWQGASQVEAPVLDFYRKERRVVAHGEAGSEAAGSVRTVLTGMNSAKDSAKSGKKTQDGPVRVLSREMVYIDSARTIDFKGGVKVLDQDETLTSNEATVWLAASSPAAQASHAPGGLMGGKVDHMVAPGAVVLDQPGRKGTGDRLVYTASDGVFVLTGTKAAAPKVVDEAQGMTTGAALRFRTGDDSVEVLGSQGSDHGKATGRVRSETRARQ